MDFNFDKNYLGNQFLAPYWMRMYFETMKLFIEATTVWVKIQIKYHKDSCKQQTIITCEGFTVTFSLVKIK